MNDADFKNNFRITRATFDLLVMNLTNLMEKKITNCRRPVPVDKRIAIGLYTLSTPAEYRTIGNLFGVSKGTVMNCFKDLAHSLCQSDLKTQYLKIPDEGEFIRISHGFQSKSGYINAVGAIDGAHIRVRVPVDQKNAYFNHHEDYSILTIAICDHRYRIWWLKTGAPGRSNDAGCFKDSQLYNELEAGTLLPSSGVIVNGVQIPFHLIGDSAFALTNYMCKPYRFTMNMSEQKINFNRRLSKARVTIENTFGRLKGRWRRLLKDLFEVKLNDVSSIILAACILHNICERNNDDFIQDWFILPVGSPSVSFTVSQENDLPYRVALANYYTNGMTIVAP